MDIKQEKASSNLPLGANAPNGEPFFRLENGIRKLNLFVNHISKGILFFIMILTTCDVIGRYFFHKPVTGAYELTGLGLAVMVLFSLGRTQMAGDHIAIDILTSKMKPKPRAVMNGFMSLLLLVLMLLTTWQLYEYARRLWDGHQVTSDMGLPVFVFAILGCFGLLLFSLTILLNTLKYWLKAVQRHDS